MIKLLKKYPLLPPKVVRKQESQKDGTIKYVYKLNDGNIIEGVLMSYKYGNTLCVSTQVGCRMGCKFCASTLGGLVRNLSAGEILGQVIFVNRDIGGDLKNRKIIEDYTCCDKWTEKNIVRKMAINYCPDLLADAELKFINAGCSIVII